MVLRLFVCLLQLYMIVTDDIRRHKEMIAMHKLKDLKCFYVLEYMLWYFFQLA